MLKKLIINTLIIFGLAYLLTGITVNSIWTALLVAIVLGLLNLILRPIFLFLSIPINILTLGLFTFVINAIIVMITAYLIAGFTIINFGWALLFSLIIALVNSIFGGMSKR
jgi:putative membrane protein